MKKISLPGKGTPKMRTAKDDEDFSLLVGGIFVGAMMLVGGGVVAALIIGAAYYIWNFWG